MRTILALMLVALPAIAVAGPTFEDQSAIRTIIEQETEAWNRGDAKAYSVRFAQDGGFTNILGMVFYGRQPFEDRHEEIFTTFYKGSRLKQSIRKLRFVTQDVAVVDIDTELTGFAGLPPTVRAWPDGVLRTRLQQVLVKREGIWWIEAYHNVEARPVPETK
jgi:uncharacterized protein (TIGR02246 family)